jgi:hypothetical protein
MKIAEASFSVTLSSTESYNLYKEIETLLEKAGLSAYQSRESLKIPHIYQLYDHLNERYGIT